MGIRDSGSEFRCFTSVTSFRNVTIIVALYFTGVRKQETIFRTYRTFVYIKKKKNSTVRKLVVWKPIHGHTVSAGRK